MGYYSRTCILSKCNKGYTVIREMIKYPKLT